MFSHMKLCKESLRNSVLVNSLIENLFVGFPICFGVGVWFLFIPPTVVSSSIGFNFNFFTFCLI